jgi:mRNA interferase RelE/StbE
LTRPARKALQALTLTIQRRVRTAIDRLAENPYPPGSKKLEDGDGKMRVRVGEYRIIYEVHGDVLLVLVLKIGDRKDVYRRRK